MTTVTIKCGEDLVTTFHFTLLAKDGQGFAGLLHLLSLPLREGTGKIHFERVELEWDLVIRALWKINPTVEVPGEPGHVAGYKVAVAAVNEMSHRVSFNFLTRVVPESEGELDFEQLWITFLPQAQKD